MAYKLVPEERTKETSFLSKAIRYPAQVGKEVASTVAGFPGDIGNLINTFAAKPLTKAITGREGLPYEETTVGKIFPTSAQHRENLESGIDYLKPKNKSERFVADLATDTASLFLPLKTKVPFKNSLIKSFGTALGANVLGESVKDLTGDEKKGAYTKMGSLLALSLLSPGSANKLTKDLYSEVNSLLPKNATASGIRLQHDLNGLKSNILKGRSSKNVAPSEKFVLDEADKVLKLIKGNNISMDSLVAAKRSLNENLQGVYQTIPEKIGRSRAKKLATQINSSIQNTMKDYGKANPEWYKIQSSADQAYGAVANSNFISNSIKKHVTYNPITHGLLHVLGGAVATASPVVLGYYPAKILYRIAKSPVLKKHYEDVLRAAVSQDAVVLNKELAKLDHALQKEGPKEKWRFVD